MVPLMHLSASQTLVTALITLLGKSCIAAVKIAAPLIVTLVLSNIALGIMARLVPHLNVFLLSFAVSIGVGLVVLWCAQPYFLGVMRTLMQQLGHDLLTLMRLLAGG